MWVEHLDNTGSARSHFNHPVIQTCCCDRLFLGMAGYYCLNKSFSWSWDKCPLLSLTHMLLAGKKAWNGRWRWTWEDGFKKRHHFLNPAGPLEAMLLVCGLLNIEKPIWKQHRIGRTRNTASAFTLWRPQNCSFTYSLGSLTAAQQQLAEYSVGRLAQKFWCLYLILSS